MLAADASVAGGLVTESFEFPESFEPPESSFFAAGGVGVGNRAAGSDAASSASVEGKGFAASCVATDSGAG